MRRQVRVRSNSQLTTIRAAIAPSTASTPHSRLQRVDGDPTAMADETTQVSPAIPRTTRPMSEALLNEKVPPRANSLSRRPMAHIGHALADSMCAVGPLPLVDDDPLWPRPRLRRRLLRPPLQATRMASHGRTRIRRRTSLGGVRQRQYKPASPQRQHAKHTQSFKRAAAPPRDGLRVVRS
jgi:hypothetical protein